MIHCQLGKDLEKGFGNPIQNKRQPIKDERTHANESQTSKQVLIVERIRTSQAVTRKAIKAIISSKLQITQKYKQMNEPSSSVRETSNSRNSKMYLQSDYQEDRYLIKMVILVKVNNVAQTERLPPPWREKFTSLSWTIAICYTSTKNL